jgi:hypothetical protein
LACPTSSFSPGTPLNSDLRMRGAGERRAAAFSGVSRRSSSGNRPSRSSSADPRSR